MSARAYGTLVADRYRLGRVIGVGGMGVVYEAEQVSLRRTVAIKMLPRQHVGSEQAVQRLISEARALSRIEHPGVVRVIDAGRGSEGQAFLAMEYLEGCTFKQLLAQHGPLPWRWVIAAMGQCLDALEVVHRAGFLHRDIKPSNCFCCSCDPVEPAPLASQPPAIKLIDFGIAKAERSRRSKGAPEAEGADAVLAGTPAYWAPELAEGGVATRGTDVYSVGATLYELLTGELPSVRAGAIEPPSAVNPGVGIPADLDAVVLEALSADPARRYDSAAALALALRAIDVERLQGETWPGQEAPPAASRPARLALGATPSGEGVQLSRLRAKVRQFWIDGVLRASLVASLPTPPRTLEESLVAGLGEALQEPPPSLVPEARSTAELFEQHGRSLLIVGPAGSGKTTQLLFVARQLLDGGRDEVPVVLTLSAWTGERQDLDDWLASELRSKYQVPSALSRAWLRRGLILPLLDGFDEIPTRQRAAAARAINRAMADGRLPGLLVTTRSKEYLDAGERLALGAGLRLHPLPAKAVEEACRVLSTSSQLSPEMWANVRPLLDSPLAISLLATLGNAPDIFATVERGAPQLDDLLDAYTERMIQRSGKAKLPCEPAELLDVIMQLSHELRANDTDIFVPDGVQPSWLHGNASKVAYAFISRLLGASIYSASLIASFGFTPLHNNGMDAGLGFGLALAGSTALTTGLVHGAVAARRLISTRHVPLGRRAFWLRVVASGAVSGTLNAAILWIWAGHPMAAVLAFEVAMLAAPLASPHEETGFVRGDIRLIDQLRFSFTKGLRSAIFGVAAGIIAAVVVAEDATAMALVVSCLTSLWFLFGGLRGRQVGVGGRPYARVLHSLSRSMLIGVLVMPLTVLPTALSYGLKYGFFAALTTGAVAWLWYGGMALTQYAVLRSMLGVQGARYFNTKYLEAAADRALLHRLGGGYLFVHPMLRSSLARRHEQRAARERER
jgi:serine/threonine protein kinase